MFDYLNDMEFLTALDKLNIKTHYAKIICFLSMKNLLERYKVA